MSKVHKVMHVDPDVPGTSTEQSSTDWTKCFLCQEDITDALRCPATNPAKSGSAGYQTIAFNLTEFDKIDALPKSIPLTRLDDGDGVEATLTRHQAKYHDSCRLSYNKTKLLRAEKRKSVDNDEVDLNVSLTRKCARQLSNFSTEVTCFFCGKDDKLISASSFGLDRRVRLCAHNLQDQPLIAKLSAGDLIAQEVKYHLKCLVALYNRNRAATHSTDEESTDATNHGIAFAELVSYIEDAYMDEFVAPVFRMTDLKNLYINRMAQLGTTLPESFHSTRLHNRILAHFPNMMIHRQGRNNVLVSRDDIASALWKACEHDADGDAVHLATAANIVRSQILSKTVTFSGNFDAHCQDDSVPISLLALVNMILNGPNIETQAGTTSQAALTISQLIMFNCSDRRSKNIKTSNAKHTLKREPPLPVYLGSMLHTNTRKRKLVDTFYNLGLSISYDRVLSISTEMGNKLCDRYERDNAVCPPNLRAGLFTTAAVDNIDHNPSSTSAHDSFHGTGISLFQHPRNENDGVDRSQVDFEQPAAVVKKRTLSNLPDEYARVLPVSGFKEDSEVPTIDGVNKSECISIPQALEVEYRWLDHTCDVLNKDKSTVSKDSNVSWAAYHASELEPAGGSTVITSLLPLFYDKAHSVAMIRHAMTVVKTAVDQLNPGQVPVFTADQPLYTLAKLIQWCWPDMYGEDTMVVMFGGLHIEMAADKVLGDLLEGSGWTGALVEAGVASSGHADSCLKGSQVTRTRWAHQVTTSALYLLMLDAYSRYCTDLEDGTNQKQMSMDEWRVVRSTESPQFKFWQLILDLELYVCLFIRSIRAADFLLYIESLSKIVPWFFVLDHPNYARWIPVHLRDMVTLHRKHPDVFNEFLAGNFTVKKTQRIFSNMAIDQAHEQNNALVKSDGGAVGLTENPAALRRWMVSGPEMARIVGEYESSIVTSKTDRVETHHHEQTKHTQLAFRKDVSSLKTTIEVMGNPFDDNSKDLLVLDSRDIVDPSVITTLYSIEKLATEQYETYVKDRLVDRKIPISEPIKRNNLPIFSRPHVREKSKSMLQISSLKNDCSLFSRLYIASQIRAGDLDEFFKHENHAYPPSLSHLGKLRTGTKSNLVTLLEDLVPEEQVDPPIPVTDVTILDGAAIVNMLHPGAAKTFADYSSQVFLPYVQYQLQHADRVDIVWDDYRSDSLKGDTRSKRGHGIRRRVEPANYLPRNWSEFLRIDENKIELFSFLSTSVVNMVTPKQVISTNGRSVLCIQPRDISALAPCTHEEADTRMFVHVQDAVSLGYTKITIRTVDTDVVVLAVMAAQNLKIDLWLAFGTGKHFRYIAAHRIANVLGPEKSVTLPMFHAITGCDTVSFFGGKGKKSAWEAWTSSDITETFAALASTPEVQVVNSSMKKVERFVVILYDRTSMLEHVNDARKQLFTQKGRSIDGIPPTQAALLEHTKRAAFQAGHVWGQMMVPSPFLPSPGDWGWQRNEAAGKWDIFWTSLAEAASSCRELLRCGCKKGCKGQCKCRKAALQCTALCYCGGECLQGSA